MAYTEENFLRGFDLCPGFFYTIRHSLIESVLATRTDTKDLNDYDAKWDMVELAETLTKTGIIANKLKSLSIPSIWRRDMLYTFVSQSVVSWMKNNARVFNRQKDRIVENGKLLPGAISYIQDATTEPRWTFGPARISPRAFVGWYQFQHLKLDTRIIQTGNSHMEIKIPVRSLVPNPHYQTTARDLDIKTLFFSRLIEELQNQKIVTVKDWENGEWLVRYTLDDVTGQDVAIEDDESLQTGIKYLRKKGSLTVPIVVLDNDYYQALGVGHTVALDRSINPMLQVTGNGNREHATKIRGKILHGRI
ncbi:hypothetical protein K491DRAFT_690527 [Lophiostoma macrostomum CBS 122681]|uniref:Uncharacterized protein n=1 Tax=Lophiostoma macrostomum CBS 122681 TaxID=1314788 RepID=A0A6A6TFE5_9PLEO|nr:hypothetical protein K491DRAFT_690527 [Lophiostoma macrostomum CBS 122681]